MPTTITLDLIIICAFVCLLAGVIAGAVAARWVAARQCGSCVAFEPTEISDAAGDDAADGDVTAQGAGGRAPGGYRR